MPKMPKSQGRAPATAALDAERVRVELAAAGFDVDALAPLLPLIAAARTKPAAPLPAEEAPSRGDALLSYADAARLLSLPIGTLYAKVARREIPFVRLGSRTVRFRRPELEAWLSGHANRPARSAA